MKSVKEDNYVLLSGLNHFAYCRRSWALIQIENQWSENYYTIDGKITHEKAHDSFSSEKRGELIISRGMPVKSEKHMMSGVCDVVEFHKSDRGVPLNKRDGLWEPVPIEYKRNTNHDNSAGLQLCAQAMCLEEMLCCPRIEKGYLYFTEQKRRELILLTEDMRNQVIGMITEMHNYMKRHHTPSVKKSKKCKNCSLSSICLPEIFGTSAQKYVNEIWEDNETLT